MLYCRAYFSAGALLHFHVQETDITFEPVEDPIVDEAVDFTIDNGANPFVRARALMNRLTIVPATARVTWRGPAEGAVASVRRSPRAS